MLRLRSYVASIEFIIHMLQHGVCEIIVFSNGIWTEGLVNLDFVREHVKGVAPETVSVHSSMSSTRCNTAYGSSGPLMDNLLYGFSVRLCY